MTIADLRAVLDGYAPHWIDPPVLQPAGLYLELIGEDLRARAYLTGDSESLCLRPDMTVPAVRAALDLDLWRSGGAVAYEGPVFRRQPPGSTRETEFTQLGAEWFASRDEITSCEIDAFAAAIEMCARAQVTPLIKLGDVGLFSGLVGAVGASPRAAQRLTRAFAEAGGLTKALAHADTTAPTSALARALAALPAQEAESAVRELLANAGVTLVGGRPFSEIVARLQDQAIDSEQALTARHKAMISSALALEGHPTQLAKQLDELLKAPDVAAPEALHAAIARFMSRWEKLAPLAKGFDVSAACGFGRGLGYYDGFLFELEAPKLGARAALGGGGRYDKLLHQIAAAEKKPDIQINTWCAAGFALRPGRLAEARQ
jgi:ATP phosphoribosyltransferase regulatory subunit